MFHKSGKTILIFFTIHSKDNLNIEANENKNCVWIWNTIFWEATNCGNYIKLFNKKRKGNFDEIKKNKKSGYIS